MIASWRDAWLRDFYLEDVRGKKVPAELRDRLFRKLQLIEDSTTEADLRVPPSNHFERLRGTLEGWRSVRVNERWRLVFRWEDGMAWEIYLDDHSYR